MTVHDFPSIQQKDDFSELVNKLCAYKFSFILSSEQWRSIDTLPLNWEEVKFIENNKDIIPEKRGVYVFIVRHENGFFPDRHGYIFYVGETGNKKEHRNLRKRYAEYLKEAECFKKRPKVYRMLSSFKNDLYFSYAVIDDLSIDTTDIESRLCDALLPWAVSDDFSAEVRPVIKAVWS